LRSRVGDVREFLQLFASGPISVTYHESPLAIGADDAIFSGVVTVLIEEL